MSSAPPGCPGFVSGIQTHQTHSIPISFSLLYAALAEEHSVRKKQLPLVGSLQVLTQFSGPKWLIKWLMPRPGATWQGRMRDPGSDTLLHHSRSQRVRSFRVMFTPCMLTDLPCCMLWSILYRGAIQLEANSSLVLRSNKQQD